MNDKNILTVEELSNYLGYSIKSIYLLTSTRKIPHYKPNGRKIFFKKDEINHWISKGKIKTDDELHEESYKYGIY